MERQTQLNIRVSLEEKAQILKAAKASGMKLSEYVRSQALLKPTAVEDGLYPVREEFTPAPETTSPSDIDLARLTAQLKAQGMTTPVAAREAKKRLGL